jgi:hypothetical protein
MFKIWDKSSSNWKQILCKKNFFSGLGWWSPSTFRFYLMWERVLFSFSNFKQKLKLCKSELDKCINSLKIGCFSVLVHVENWKVGAKKIYIFFWSSISQVVGMWAEAPLLPKWFGTVLEGSGSAIQHSILKFKNMSHHSQLTIHW